MGDIDKKKDKPGDPKSIARFSAEQTARFLGGGDLGRPEWTDEAIVGVVQKEQRKRLRSAFKEITPILAQALHELSPQTEQRLTQYYQAAEEGNTASYHYYLVMVAELCKQALEP